MAVTGINSEDRLVQATFAEHLGVKVIKVDAADRYFAADEYPPSSDGHQVWADAVLASLDP